MLCDMNRDRIERWGLRSWSVCFWRPLHCSSTALALPQQPPMTSNVNNFLTRLIMYHSTQFELF